MSRSSWSRASGSRRAARRRTTSPRNQYRGLLEEGITIQFLALGEIVADKEFRLTRAEYAPDGRAIVEWHYLGT